MVSFACKIESPGQAWDVNGKGVKIMTDREFALLNFIQAHQRPHWTDVLNGFDPGDSQEIQSIMRTMLNVLIKTTDKVSRPPSCRLQLTDAGVLALRAEQERRVREALLLEQNAKDKQAEKDEAAKKALREQEDRKAEKKADRIFQVFITLLSSLLSLIGGLLLEYHLDIIEWLISVF